jgi:hypothetical protein
MAGVTASLSGGEIHGERELEAGSPYPLSLSLCARRWPGGGVRRWSCGGVGDPGGGGGGGRASAGGWRGGGGLVVLAAANQWGPWCLVSGGLLRQKRFVLAGKRGLCWRVEHPPATLCQHKSSQ